MADEHEITFSPELKSALEEMAIKNGSRGYQTVMHEILSEAAADHKFLNTNKKKFAKALHDFRRTTEGIDDLEGPWGICLEEIRLSMTKLFVELDEDYD